MEKTFDCVVGKLTLPEKELQWMSAMWSGVELSELKSARPNHNKTVSSYFDQLLCNKGRTTRSKAKQSAREEDESGIGTQETLQQRKNNKEQGETKCKGRGGEWDRNSGDFARGKRSRGGWGWEPRHRNDSPRGSW